LRSRTPAGLLTLACVLLAVGCGPRGEPERKFALRDSGIPVHCSTGKDVEFGTIEGGREWFGFVQDPFSRCSFELIVPPASRLSFRLSLAAISHARGASAKVAIHSRVGETNHVLLVREVSPDEAVFEGSVELSAGASTISLWVAASEKKKGSSAFVAWSDLEIWSDSPDEDDGLPWIVGAEKALAPFLETHGNSGAPREQRRRLLIIGFDGASWQLMERLLDEGKMPYLNALRARGRWGVLRSTVVPESAMGWSAIRTGVNPGKSGMYTFYSGVQPRRSFWHFLGDRDLTSIVVAVPTASALHPINGVLIHGWAGADTPRWALPEDIIPPLERAGYDPTLADLKNTRYFLERMQTRTDVSSLLLENMDWDLGFVVFEYTDSVGHRFGLYTREWDEVYRAVDGHLATLLEVVDDQTTVMVISDHGWRYFERSIHLNQWLRSNDFDGWKANLPVSASTVSISRKDVGTAQPPKEPRDSRARALRRIRRGLLELRDPKTGQKVIERVRSPTDVFHGPYSDRAPGRLLVEADEDYRMLTDRSRGKGKGRRRVFGEPGDTHAFEGIYVLAGPGIEAVEGPQASIYDIAPTVLNFFGIPPPVDADGATLMDFGVTDAGAQPPEPLYFSEDASGTAEGGGEVSRELEENLRTLGYIE